jgi:hypothetical protein
MYAVRPMLPKMYIRKDRRMEDGETQRSFCARIVPGRGDSSLPRSQLRGLDLPFDKHTFGVGLNPLKCADPVEIPVKTDYLSEMK